MLRNAIVRVTMNVSARAARVHAGLWRAGSFLSSVVLYSSPIRDAINRLEVSPLTPLCRSGEINERGAAVQLFPPRGARAAWLS